MRTNKFLSFKGNFLKTLSRGFTLKGYGSEFLWRKFLLNELNVSQVV